MPLSKRVGRFYQGLGGGMKKIPQHDIMLLGPEGFTERRLSIPSLVPKTELGNEKAAGDSCCSEGTTKIYESLRPQL